MALRARDVYYFALSFETFGVLGFNSHFASVYFVVPFMSEFIESFFLSNWSCEVLYDFPEVGKHGPQCAQGDVNNLLLSIYKSCVTL